LYIVFLQLASAHHILSDPGMSTEWKVLNTSYFMYFAVLASMIHGLTIPGAMEVAQRAKGYNKGLFEWLRKAPWGNPSFSGVFISIIGFGFLGGISGVMMGTEQLNMLIHNTIYVPGHFHATVVIGTTLSFMALTYFLIPVLFKREIISPTLARWQPYLFGFSMYFFCLLMMGAGTLGVSRRHWDMAFSGSALAYEWPGAAYLMMGLVGIAGIAAIAGGAIYIYVTVGSLLWGKRVVQNKVSSQPTPIPVGAPSAAAQSYGSLGFAAPGTFVLAMVFLASFILYYFINWKYLSTLWGLS
ncbi:MAG: cbb3-type cytochrome c oxidase subunit I, partial [Dokdonella sp.]